MKNIVTKQFQILTDINLAWDFIVEIYNIKSKENKESIEAPFFEYALTSSWMNKDYLHLCRFWLDNDKIVAFVRFNDKNMLPFKINSFLKDKKIGSVLFVCVDSKYADKNYDDIMIRVGRRYLVKRGCKKVITLATDNIKLYKQQGFSVLRYYQKFEMTL